MLDKCGTQLQDTRRKTSTKKKTAKQMKKKLAVSELCQSQVLSRAFTITSTSDCGAQPPEEVDYGLRDRELDYPLTVGTEYKGDSFRRDRSSSEYSSSRLNQHHRRRTSN